MAVCCKFVICVDCVAKKCKKKNKRYKHKKFRFYNKCWGVGKKNRAKTLWNNKKCLDNDAEAQFFNYIRIGLMFKIVQMISKTQPIANP